MTAYVMQKPGQSIYDLCLQAYGTLNLLIKFCRDNNITDTANIPERVNYAYDTTLVKYQGNKNQYATDYKEADDISDSVFDDAFSLVFS